MKGPVSLGGGDVLRGNIGSCVCSSLIPPEAVVVFKGALFAWCRRFFEGGVVLLGSLEVA